MRSLSSLALFTFALGALTLGGATGCGSDDPSTCSGTLTGKVTGDFTCLFQASYMNNSVLTFNTSTGPAGLRDVSLAFRVATVVTPQVYAFGALQSVTGQVVHEDFPVFQVLNMPIKGTAELELTEVDDSLSTSQEQNYGLAGRVDATLLDSTGLTMDSVTVHIDF